MTSSRLVLEIVMEGLVEASKEVIAEEKMSRGDRDPVARSLVVGRADAIYQVCDWILNWCRVFNLDAEGVSVPDFDPAEELMRPWNPK
jgi:hypothetical protein